MEINIIDGKEFTLNGIRFIIDMSWAGKRQKTTEESFTIVKNKTYFDFYRKIRHKNFRSIFELGFFEGGSSVFLSEYFQPEQLTCIDRRQEPIVPVENYISSRNKQDRFRMRYGFDQADKAGLTELVDSFHGGSLDLVIDDASHQYELTRKSFEALFPRLKHGGLYIIEDYGWAHDARYQAEDHVWANNPSLTNLVFELTMVVAGSQGLIEKIEINRGLCAMTRGSAPVDSETFRLEDHYVTRGRKLNLI